MDRNSVVANFATTVADGKTYQVDYYNLDVIISVGYRVKSLRGTQFRIWANSVRKEYLIKGFSRCAANGLKIQVRGWYHNTLFTKNQAYLPAVSGEVSLVSAVLGAICEYC